MNELYSVHFEDGDMTTVVATQEQLRESGIKYADALHQKTGVRVTHLVRLGPAPPTEKKELQ